MKNKLVNVQLAVDLKGDSLIANMIFLNISDGDIYLDGQTICIDNETRRNVFEILDEQNAEVGYTGAYVYREVVPQDYVKLEVGQKLESKIVLSDVYKLKKGQRYTIQYTVFHPTYMDDAGFTQFESNKVEISY
ncbi:MAG TPA: hypothetical protein VIM79_10225 [Niastella sp.]